MMPLSMLSVGSTDTIKKITGKDEVRRFLSSLGLVEGECVTVVSEIHGNLIHQVTRDHSYVEEMVARGQMVRGSEAYNSQKNIITRATNPLPLKTRYA